MGEGEDEGESPAGDPGWLLQKNYLKKRSGIFQDRPSYYCMIPADNKNIY